MRPTKPDVAEDYTPEAIAAQIAAFPKSGGKVQQIEDGAQVAPTSIPLRDQTPAKAKAKFGGPELVLKKRKS